MLLVIIGLISLAVGIVASKVFITICYLYVEHAPFVEFFRLLQIGSFLFVIIYLMLVIIGLPIFIFIDRKYGGGFFPCQIASLISFLVVVIGLAVLEVNILSPVLDHFHTSLSLMIGSIFSGAMFWIGSLFLNRV